MPKINVYLPDELAESVRRAGIPVSSVCQRALADAVAAADGPPLPDSSAPELARYTNRARQVVTTARAAQAAPTSVDVANGIVAEGHNLAVAVLNGFDVDLDDFVAELRGLARAPGARADEMTVVLQRAAEQALDLANNYVGCEHLLLGILEASPGEVTADALRAVGVDAKAARRTISAALAGITYARDAGMTAGLTAPIRSALEEIRTRLAHLESR